MSYERGLSRTNYSCAGGNEIFLCSQPLKLRCGLAVMLRRMQAPDLGGCSPILLLSEELSAGPHPSARAQEVKIADKISNVLGVSKTPPADWSMERRRQYLDWTEQVVAGCRGRNAALENFYDQVLSEGRKALNQVPE